jgi:hypothetical protein
MGQIRLLSMRYSVYLEKVLANRLRRYDALKVSWLSYYLEVKRCGTSVCSCIID